MAKNERDELKGWILRGDGLELDGCDGQYGHLFLFSFLLIGW